MASPSRHLVGQAQERLEALAVAVGPWPAARTTYSHRQCADCRGRKLIWVRGNSSLCDSCWEKGFATTPGKPMSTRPPSPRFSTGQLIISNESLDPRVGEPIEHLGHPLESRRVAADSKAQSWGLRAPKRSRCWQLRRCRQP